MYLLNYNVRRVKHNKYKSSEKAKLHPYILVV